MRFVFVHIDIVYILNKNDSYYATVFTLGIKILPFMANAQLLVKQTYLRFLWLILTIGVSISHTYLCKMIEKLGLD